MLTHEQHGPATMVFAGTSDNASPGLDGLFPDSLDTVERPVTCSADKSELIEELTAQIGTHDEAHSLLGQKAALMLDEMLENALYAAPRSGDGSPLFPERKPRILQEGESILLRYRFDGRQLVLEVRDSWGTLTQSRVFSYLAVNTSEEEPDPERAGRGLFFMWQLFDQFYVRIYPGRETVVGGSLLLMSDK